MIPPPPRPTRTDTPFPYSPLLRSALVGSPAVTFPLVEAAAACHGPVTILHFDAHPDLYDDFAGNPRSHASPFARICEAGHAKRLVQVGIRTLTHHCREQAARFGVEIVPMADFSDRKRTRLNSSH